ncbi:unnamed protein product [Rhizoctonia solani]|uniref:Uncharacterized protein n=1 Tax=Rhizoctonia solani TaxID=456999 RepID=A0A8H3BZ63_9AGAM|nr:unnamed protein product [Rhizoctonia solani]
MSAALREAFRGNVFPSIQKIILPAYTHEILRCCPEIREVTCNDGDDTRLVGALVYNGSKKLEVLRGIYGGPSTMKRLSALGPPLRCIEVSEIPKMVPIYSTFPDLSVIELNSRELEGNPIGGPVEDDIKLAENILRACAQYKPGKKGGKSYHKAADDSVPEPGSPDPEPRVVRLRKFITLPYDHNESPEEYIPFKIEEVPVDVTLEHSG